MLVQEQAGRVLFGQAMEDALNDLAVRHALLEARPIIATTRKQARRARETLFTRIGLGASAVHASGQTGADATIFVEERKG